MKEVIYKFLDYILTEKMFSDHTEVNYEIDLFKFEDYLKMNNKNYLKLKYQDISDYIIYLRKAGYEPSSINRNISSLRSFYTFLLKENIVSSNPLDLIKTIKEPKKLPNYFKYEEYLNMLDTLKEETPLNIRNLLIIELLFATGVRVSELVNIKLKDINTSERQIKIIGKGNKERIVYYGSYASDALDKYLSDSRPLLLKNKNTDYLLINNNGGNLTDRGVRGIISEIIKKTGIKTNISPHSFRHSFATIMLNEGASIKSVQELLGHQSIDTTSIYTHLSNNDVRRAYLNAHPRAKR
ncbi:MAG TPA: tyrosine recombinase [Mollicutes bacterium]|nr:tyrosine recombinase [Mollicutes bacterium]